MEGGTTFHFITEGFDVAFEHAEAAAGDLGVDIAGGASTVRQAFAAGVIDELNRQRIWFVGQSPRGGFSFPEPFPAPQSTARIPL